MKHKLLSFNTGSGSAWFSCSPCPAPFSNLTALFQHAKFLALLLLFTVYSESISAQDYTFTLSKNCFTESGGSVVSDGITWTHACNDESKGHDYDTSNKGSACFKFGTNKSTYPTSVTLTSSAYEKKIRKVVVYAGENKSKTHKLNVKVGTTALGSEVTVNKDNNALNITAYTFETDNSQAVAGAVSVAFTSGTGPLYVEKIEIYYYEIKEKHIAKFFVNGVEQTEQSVEEGAAISFPDSDPAVSGWLFAGWTTSEILTAQANAPEVLVKSYTMGTTDLNFHAVFAKEGEKVTRWKKINITDATSEGIYALISPAGNAFNGTITKGHGQSTVAAFSFDDAGYATTAPEGTLELTLSASGSGFTMYNATKGYLYAKEATTGNLEFQESENSYWYYDTNASNWLYAANSAYLRVYTNTFRTYKSSSNDDLYMARKEDTPSLSDYCTHVTPVVELQLTELSDNASAIADASGKQADVTIARTLKQGVWNTICLPFSLTNEQAQQLFGEGYSLQKFSSADANTFAFVAESDGFKAGVPYLVKPTIDTTGDTRFEGVTIDADAATTVTCNGVQFVGIYNQTSFTPNDETILFFGVNTQGSSAFFFPTDNKPLNSFRAYLKLPEPVAAPRLSIEENGETTFIDSITAVGARNLSHAVYSMDGRQIATDALSLPNGTLPKGIYIVNGRKVVIK